jgi:hypothetical protein
MKKKIIILIVLIINITTYGQEMKLYKNSKKIDAVIKVNLRNNYKLFFYENGIIIKKIKFIGSQFFKIKRAERIDTDVDKKNKIFRIYIVNNSDNFKEERILDYQEEQEMEI